MSTAEHVPERLLSVAPRYRADLTPLQNGHFTVYHDDLRAAAGRLGIDLTVLAGDDGPSAPGVLPCLPGREPGPLADAVATQVRPGDVVMVYEGSLPLLRALHPVARAHPAVTFVVNLFGPEDGIDGPADLARLDGHGPVADPSAAPSGPRTDLPDNLRVTAETPERVVLARAAGIPVRAAWALHSTITTVPSPVDDARRPARPGPLRVLVPLRAGGFDPDPVGDVAHVLHRLRREVGPDRVRLSVTRHDAGRLDARVRGDRLARLGATIVAPGADSTAYAALIAAHDAVWLTGAAAPSGFSYRTQSSGKTLDALVAGVPVVGVAGTSPAREPLRWTGLPLGYRTRDEALAALLRLLADDGAVAARLRAQQAHLRTTHSPEATIRRVLAVAAHDGGAWDAPLLDRPADLAPDAGLLEGLRGTRPGGTRPDGLRPSLRTLTTTTLTTTLVVRRTVRIPVSRRAWWALRQRLSRLKAAVVSRRRQAPPSSP